MKKVIRFLSLALILLMIFALSSCQENDDLREQTIAMFDALIENDFDSAYKLVSGITTEKQFESIYSQMTSYIDGVKEYEIKQVGINTTTENGIKLVRATYLITTNTKNYIVEAQTRTDVEGLYGFQILESQINSDGIKNGTITSMKGADFVQWAFMIFGVLEFIFVIAVFIDALRQKFNKKGMWLAFILLGTIAITVNISSNNVNFNLSAIISLINNTSYIKYATGISSIRIMLPVVAIIYLMKRKDLINEYKNTNEQNFSSLNEDCNEEKMTECVDNSIDCSENNE